DRRAAGEHQTSGPSCSHDATEDGSQKSQWVLSYELSHATSPVKTFADSVPGLASSIEPRPIDHAVVHEVFVLEHAELRVQGADALGDQSDLGQVRNDPREQEFSKFTHHHCVEHQLSPRVDVQAEVGQSR